MNEQAPLEQAQRWIELGRIDQARRAAIEALAINPNSGEGLRLLAFCHLRDGDAGAAETVARNAVGVDPENDRGYFLVAWALSQRGKVDEAYLWLREAWRIDPLDPDYHVFRAALHASGGEWPQGETSVRDALNIDPDHAWGRRTLGEILLATGRGDEAEELLRDTLRASPNDGALHHLLGQVAMQRGEFADARDAMTAAARARPDDATITTGLSKATLWARLGPFGGMVARLETWWETQRWGLLSLAAVPPVMAWRTVEQGRDIPISPGVLERVCALGMILVAASTSIDLLSRWSVASRVERRAGVVDLSILLAAALSLVVDRGPGVSFPALIAIVGVIPLRASTQEPPGERRDLFTRGGWGIIAVGVATLALSLLGLVDPIVGIAPYAGVITLLLTIRAVTR